jgi:hypothetical protein
MLAGLSSAPATKFSSNRARLSESGTHPYHGKPTRRTNGVTAAWGGGQGFFLLVPFGWLFSRIIGLEYTEVDGYG